MAIFDRIAEGIDALSFRWLAILAVGMALAPWPFGPLPHLIEKTTMLFDGSLRRPIDIFDLFVHSLPGVLLGVKVLFHYASRPRDEDQPSAGS